MSSIDFVGLVTEAYKSATTDETLSREALTRWAATIKESSRLLVSKQRIDIAGWSKSRGAWQVDVVVYSKEHKKITDKTFRAYELDMELSLLFADGLSFEIGLAY